MLCFLGITLGFIGSFLRGTVSAFLGFDCLAFLPLQFLDTAALYFQCVTLGLYARFLGVTDALGLRLLRFEFLAGFSICIFTGFALRCFLSVSSRGTKKARWPGTRTSR